MNVLVLAGGSHQAPLTANEYPVWLTDVDGTLLLERQVGLLQALSPTKFTFIFRSEDESGLGIEISSSHVENSLRCGIVVLNMREKPCIQKKIEKS